MKNTLRFLFSFLLFAFILEHSFSQNTITSLVIKNTGYSTIYNKPITIGHVFKSCDVLKDQGIVIFNNNTELPCQIDVKTTYSNGSALYGILSFVLPEIGPKESKTLLIKTSNESNASLNINAEKVLQTDFDAVASFTKNGKLYTVSARDLLQSSSSNLWLKGSVATEFILSGIPKTSTGEPDTALNVEFQVRFYDLEKALVSVVVENVWALERKNIVYDVTVKLGKTNQVQVLNKSNVTQYYYSRWRRAFWWGSQPEDVEVHFDLPYIISTGAIPRYDTTVKINKFIWSYGDTSLMGNATITQYFPTTGGREDIGLYPAWAARYMLSFEKMYEREVYYTGQQSASIPIHVKDKTTGKLWSIEDHPTSSLLDAVRNQQRPNDALPIQSGFSPWAPDDAHQPSLAYIPYLFTGEYFFLEELQYWANWNFLSQNFATRGYHKGLLYQLQTRGIAWTLRTLSDAVFASVDNSWEKLYFNEKLDNTLQYYLENMIPSNSMGWFGSNSPYVYPDQCMSPQVGGFTAPWESDFLIIALDHLVDLGFEKAKPTRDWLLNFAINRFTNHPEYNKYDGAPYRIAVYDTNGRMYTTWNEIYQNTFYNCLSNPSTNISSNDCIHGYPNIARAALTSASRENIFNAKEAFHFLDTSLSNTCWKEYPTWAFIVGEKIADADKCSSTNITISNLIDVWPNPFTTSVNISINFPTAFPANIDIYDFTGKKIDRIISNSIHSVVSWTPKNISNGMYFINIDIEGENISKKVLLFN